MSRINPATHAVIQQIPVGSAPARGHHRRDGDVWVANSGDGTVSRINAAAGRVVDTIRVGNIPVAIASGPSGVWVANQGDDTVDQIDPGTGDGDEDGYPGRRAARRHRGRAGRRLGGERRGRHGHPHRPGHRPAERPGIRRFRTAGIAITAAAVWVANSLDLTVSRIDPATGRVTAVIGVGDGPGRDRRGQRTVYG